MNFLAKFGPCFSGKAVAEHLRRGRLGELAAKKYLRQQGMRFLVSNFRSGRGEIDLVFQTTDPPSNSGLAGAMRKTLRIGKLRFTRKRTDCLVFVEVKTRSSEEWTRPAAAVNAERRRRLSHAALDYLRLIKNLQVKIRFDIVEVLLTDGEVREIRHLPNTFALQRPYRYG